MCEETDAMLIVFSSLNLVGVELDLWVCETLESRNTVNFYPFKQIGS